MWALAEAQNVTWDCGEGQSVLPEGGRDLARGGREVGQGL